MTTHQRAQSRGRRQLISDEDEEDRRPEVSNSDTDEEYADASDIVPDREGRGMESRGPRALRRSVIDEDMDIAGDYDILEEIAEDHNYDRVDRRSIDHLREATGLRQSTPTKRRELNQVSRNKMAWRDKELPSSWRQPSKWIKPDKFSNSVPTESYLAHFEAVAEYNQWTERDKLAHLKASLVGEPAQLLWDMGDQGQMSYAALTDKLKSRFGSAEHKERYACLLRTLKRRPGQSLQELQGEVRRLMALAYPGTANTTLNEIFARDSFISALGDRELEMRIRDRDPMDLDAAFKIAVRTEAYMRPRELEGDLRREEGERIHRDSGRRTRHIREEDKTETKRNEMEIRELREQLQYYRSRQDDLCKELDQVKIMAEGRIANQKELPPGAVGQLITEPDKRPGVYVKGENRKSKPIADSTCYRCRGKGHYARSCPTIVNTSESQVDGVAQATRAEKSMTPKAGRTENETSIRKVTKLSAEYLDKAAYLRVSINGEEVDSLLDTGSETCLFPVRLVKEDQIKPVDQRLFAANGTVIGVLGTARVILQIGDGKYTVDGFVSSQITEVILGLNFLRLHKAVWNFSRATVTLNGQSFELLSRSAAGVCRRVVLEKDAEVQARTEMIVPAFVEYTGGIRTGGTWTTRPGRLAPHVHVARALIPNRSVDIPVCVVNTGEASITLPAGTPIAELEPVGVTESLKQTGRVDDRSRGEEEMAELLSHVDPNVTEEERRELKAILEEFKDAFAMSEDDIGHVTSVQHEIDTGDARPARQRLRRQSPAHQEAINEHIESMHRQGIIEPAQSPWAANIIMVRKKDNTYRCCIDFRALNDVTRKDAYALPRIDACLDSLSGAVWFSTFDLKSSYYQLEVRESDRHKTSFICRNGQWQFRRMPMGLCNSGATFQRLMDVVLSGLEYVVCLAYIDDVIVYSKTIYEHFERLRMVLKRIAEAGLKIKISKTSVLQKSVGFLGHLVTGEGIQAHPEKTRQIAEWREPQCLRDVRAFVGITSYYRKFVKNYAMLASPLTALMKKNQPFVWSDECREAFEALKRALLSPPILALPIDEAPYILDTDSSNFAIGAVLSQVQGGEERVIAYASRHLSPREQNYCTTRRELLAVVFYMKYFRCHLLGTKTPFRIRTDHAALAWLRRIPEPVGQQARWLEIMEEYRFVIEHRAGKQHGNADALSRSPCYDRRCCPYIEDQEGREELEGHDGKRVSAIVGPSDVANVGVERLIEAQRNDVDIAPILQMKCMMKEKPKWDDVANYSEKTKALWRQYDRLLVCNGVLKRVFVSDDNHDEYLQIVMPEALRGEFIRNVHAGIGGGHLGRRRTEAAIRMRAYWVGWSDDVRQNLKCCSECARYTRGKPPRRVGLSPIKCGEPWEVLALDVTGPHPVSLGGHRFILTMQDAFSKWVEAFPIRRHTAQIVARLVFEQIVLRYGAPLRILTDQGTEFQSELFAELCRLMGINKVKSTPYRPQSNGGLERFHRTLNAMLAKVVAENQSDWHLRLPSVLAAYRATSHEATRYSPNHVIFGRENRLPIDLIYDRPPDRVDDNISIDDYVNRMVERSIRDFRTVREHLGRAAVSRKRRYDLKVKDEPLCVGQKVWYYCPRRFRNRTAKWQLWYGGPYEIVRIIDPHVIMIRKNNRAKPIIVHRDKLKIVAGELNDNRAERQESRREAEHDSRVDDEVSDDPVGEGRKSARKRKIPARLNDYVCNYIFNSDRQCLRGLQKSSTMPPRVRHGCRMCRVTFSSAADLRRHERSAVHRARECGEATPPRSRRGLATRQARAERAEGQARRPGGGCSIPQGDLTVRLARFEAIDQPSSRHAGTSTQERHQQPEGERRQTTTRTSPTQEGRGARGSERSEPSRTATTTLRRDERPLPAVERTVVEPTSVGPRAARQGTSPSRQTSNMSSSDRRRAVMTIAIEWMRSSASLASTLAEQLADCGPDADTEDTMNALRRQASILSYDATVGERAWRLMRANVGVNPAANTSNSGTRTADGVSGTPVGSVVADVDDPAIGAALAEEPVPGPSTAQQGASGERSEEELYMNTSFRASSVDSSIPVSPGADVMIGMRASPEAELLMASIMATTASGPPPLSTLWSDISEDIQECDSSQAEDSPPSSEAAARA